MPLAYYFVFFLFKPWLAALGFGEHVNSESNLPAYLSAGEAVTATWVIHKGEVRGFARLHLRVPLHLEVSPVETAGASFEFDGEFVKLIWLDAPEEASFEVKLEIEASKQFQGGSFEPLWSFIENGARRDVALPADYMGSSASRVTDNPLLPSPTTWEIRGGTATDTPYLTSFYDPKRFSITRTIAFEGPDVARVEFHFTGHPKGNTLYIVESLQSACDVEIHLTEAASIEKTAETLTFNWFNSPVKNNVVVSYRIMGDLKQCLPDLHATVAFAYGEELLTFQVPSYEAATLSDPDGWFVQSPSESLEDSTVASEKSSHSSAAPIAIPEPDFGISYRVQVMAAHRYVDQKWFGKTFEFTDPIDVEPHEDWIKYTTGSFSRYEDARNRREDLNAHFNFPGPFVTAYEQGERITVQEALVLAQQQWIP